MDRLVAGDGSRGAALGAAVALSDDGSTAVVGDPSAPNSTGVGVVQVFERVDGEWTRRARLAAGDGSGGDFLGLSVAVSPDGSVAVAGAPFSDRPAGDLAGAAYVFEADGDGWTERTKLTADEGVRGALFGYSLAVSEGGERIVVGAPQEDTEERREAGAAYVFDRAGEDWTQRRRVTEAEPGRRARFGWSVATTAGGDRVVVGAPAAGEGFTVPGRAYLFDDGDGWSQTATLVPEDASNGDAVGSAVAVSDAGDTVAVGAISVDGPAGDDAGATYVFADDGEWTRQATLTPRETDADDVFGGSVGLTDAGTTVVVAGRYEQDETAPDPAPGYVFEDADDGWTRRGRLRREDGDGDEAFGASVAVSGDGTTAVVGAPEHVPEGADLERGAAYVFGRERETTPTSEAPDQSDGGESLPGFGLVLAAAALAVVAAWRRLVGDDESR